MSRQNNILPSVPIHASAEGRTCPQARHPRCLPLLLALICALPWTARAALEQPAGPTDLFGIGLVLFGFSHRVWLSLILMLLVGFGMLQGMTASNTIIQTLSPEDKRGRVMSYYTAAFMGMAPFGSLLAGSLAHWIGAPRTVLFTGSCCIAGGLWFWSRLPAIRREMRPVYEKLGIVPPRTVPVEEQAAS